MSTNLTRFDRAFILVGTFAFFMVLLGLNALVGR